MKSSSTSEPLPFSKPSDFFGGPRQLLYELSKRDAVAASNYLKRLTGEGAPVGMGHQAMIDKIEKAHLEYEAAEIQNADRKAALRARRLQPAPTSKSATSAPPAAAWQPQPANALAASLPEPAPPTQGRLASLSLDDRSKVLEKTIGGAALVHLLLAESAGKLDGATVRQLRIARAQKKQAAEYYSALAPLPPPPVRPTPAASSMSMADRRGIINDANLEILLVKEREGTLSGGSFQLTMARKFAPTSEMKEALSPLPK